MAQSDTQNPGLPSVTGVVGPRPSLARNGTTAAFVSQLLAARERLPIQRERRRESPQGAIGAYASGARMAVRRMPAGYRTSVTV